MVADNEEEKKLKLFEKLKQIPKKIKEKLGLTKTKKKKLLQPKKEKSKPIKEKIMAFLSRLKDIPLSLKDMMLLFFGDIKSMFIGIKDAIVGFFLSVARIPKITAEKASKVPGITKDIITKTSEKTKLFIKIKRKEIEESPPFVQKYLVGIKPVEKSLMITAKRPAVFYWIKEVVKGVGKNLPVEIIDMKGRTRKLREDIIEGLDTEPLSQTLTKCIELARLTKNYSDITWMERELNGYTDVLGFVKADRTHPDYRKTKAILPISFYIKGEYSLMNDDLILPFFCVKPVHWIEEIVERCKKRGSKQIQIKLPMPKELLGTFKDHYREDTINVMVPVTSLEFVLNGIKVRIHEFMFKVAEKQVKEKRRKKHLKK